MFIVRASRRRSSSHCVLKNWLRSSLVTTWMYQRRRQCLRQPCSGWRSVLPVGRALKRYARIRSSLKKECILYICLCVSVTDLQDAIMYSTAMEKGWRVTQVKYGKFARGLLLGLRGTVLCYPAAWVCMEFIMGNPSSSISSGSSVTTCAGLPGFVYPDDVSLCKVIYSKLAGRLATDICTYYLCAGIKKNILQ